MDATIRSRVLLGAVAVVGFDTAVLVGLDGSLVWRVVRVLVVLAVTALLVGAMRGGWGAARVVALVGGLAGLLVGIGIGVPHLVEGGAWVTGVVGGLALGAGAVATALSAWDLLGPLGVTGRVVAVPVGLAVAALVGLVVVPAVLATNVPPSALGDETPADHGLEYEDVELVTDDGVELAGWYVPSRNGAAVVVRHGAGSTRSDALDQAAVLAGAGYGVLLTDARGHGESGGRAMDFGWYGEIDIAAAVSHLGRRSEVSSDRIAVLGLSMGGEEAIGAIGADPRVAAAVAEGATARTDADKDWLSDEYGARGWLQEQLEWAQYRLTDLLTDAATPEALADSVAAAAPRPVLLITAGDLPDERRAAAFIESASPDSVTVWTVPDAGHTQGLETAPREWRDRVVGFLDEALSVVSGSPPQQRAPGVP